MRGPRQGPRLPGGVRRLFQSGQPGLRGRAVACLVRRLHPVQRREPDHHRVGDRAQVGEGGGRVAETEVEHSQRPERGVLDQPHGASRGDFPGRRDVVVTLVRAAARAACRASQQWASGTSSSCRWPARAAATRSPWPLPPPTARRTARTGRAGARRSARRRPPRTDVPAARRRRSCAVPRRRRRGTSQRAPPRGAGSAASALRTRREPGSAAPRPRPGPREVVREADEQVDQEAFFKSVPRVQRSGQLAELHLGRCVGPLPSSPSVRR